MKRVRGLIYLRYLIPVCRLRKLCSSLASSNLCLNIHETQTIANTLPGQLVWNATTNYLRLAISISMHSITLKGFFFFIPVVKRMALPDFFGGLILFHIGRVPSPSKVFATRHIFRYNTKLFQSFLEAGLECSCCWNKRGDEQMYNNSASRPLIYRATSVVFS